LDSRGKSPSRRYQEGEGIPAQQQKQEEEVQEHGWAQQAEQGTKREGSNPIAIAIGRRKEEGGRRQALTLVSLSQAPRPAAATAAVGLGLGREQDKKNHRS
jgi:hypothetical protein